MPKGNDFVYVENDEDNKIHTAFIGKAFSLCGSKIKKTFKFKSLYDFSHLEKCLSCRDKQRKIYQGML